MIHNGICMHNMKPSQDNLIYQATHCHSSTHKGIHKFHNQHSRSETNVKRKKKHKNIMRTKYEKCVYK